MNTCDSNTDSPEESSIIQSIPEQTSRSEVTQDYGSFESFLSSLAASSATKYCLRVSQFELYCQHQQLEIIPSSVQSFIVDLHEKYMVTTLWSIFSILKAYFMYQFHLDLKNSLPGVTRLLKQWEKQESKTQSKNVQTMDWIHCKVTVIIACYGLLRLSEIESLLFEDITFEAAAVFIKITRKKQSGVAKPSIFAIDSELCIQILAQYVNFFPKEARIGPFLRYFQAGKSTNRHIGKNKIAEYPKHVAKFLNLPTEGYTGDCWRRTSAAILAETDISLMQFKNAGGWHSDHVCQRYVEELKREKRISLGELNSKKRSRDEVPEAGCSSSNITIHVDMSHSSGSTFQYFTNHLVSYDIKKSK